MTEKEKTYKSYRQLLAILRGRGMDIPTGSVGSRVIRILEKENYYNVINGYKELFIETPASGGAEERYKAGTTFDEVYALYCFDRDLRSIHLQYLLKLETAFKATLAHEFSALYGHDNYLTLRHFKAETPKEIQDTVSLLGDIQKEIARQMSKNHPAVTHYMSEHGYIPLWVLVDVLTFGKVTMLYLHMKDGDRVRIAKKFQIDYEELHKYMSLLGQARNKCAHGERFFNFRNRSHIKARLIKNFGELHIPRDAGGNYRYGTNDLYAVAIVFAQMLQRSELREFIAAMRTLFARLEKSLHTISVGDVMGQMGYPADWENVSRLAK